MSEKWSGNGGAVSVPFDMSGISQSGKSRLKEQRQWHAWFIGVSEYSDWGIRNLPEVEVEISELGKLLKAKYGFSVKVSLNKGSDQLEKQMAKYSESLGPDDNLLIFFFGHGWLHPKTLEGYWLFPDADREDISTFWANKQMAALLGDQQAGQVLLIANSCFTGAMARDRRGTRQLVPELLGPKQTALSSLSYNVSRSFFSSGGTEIVYGRGKDKLSVLGWGLKKVLEEKQHAFGARELFLGVHDLLRENANQTPVYIELLDLGHKPGADFVFVPR